MAGSFTVKAVRGRMLAARGEKNEKSGQMHAEGDSDREDWPDCGREHT